MSRNDVAQSDPGLLLQRELGWDLLLSPMEFRIQSCNFPEHKHSSSFSHNPKLIQNYVLGGKRQYIEFRMERSIRHLMCNMLH